MTTTTLLERRSDFTVCAAPRTRRGTWQMTRAELARVVANHRGYLAGPGGWLYKPDGGIVCQGYEVLGERLERDGTIVVGRGVNWR